MLITEPHIESPDDFYEALIDAHRELETAQSHELNAKLVLLLSNHIGRLSVLKQALSAARTSTLNAARTSTLSTARASTLSTAHADTPGAAAPNGMADSQPDEGRT